LQASRGAAQEWAIDPSCGSGRAEQRADALAQCEPRRSRARSGFTLLELAIGTAILMVGVLGFSVSIASIGRSSQKQREMARATQAAREVLERIQAEAFADAFRRFNADPADDPGGPGTGPGAAFAVEGLSAIQGDLDGRPGEVIFPAPGGSPAQLREDIVLDDLGMPRDLNGDGAVDAADHALDYKLLPVLVRVRWRSPAGTGLFELKTMLAEY
jgi:type II secretory pathway pseudopilin PulG